MRTAAGFGLAVDDKPSKLIARFNQKVVVGTARLLFAVLTEQLFGSFHDWHSKFFSSLQ